MKLLSIVVPCYNEEENVALFYKELQFTIEEKMSSFKLKYEILFINDGSKDDTLSMIKKLAKENEYVQYISFSRNFGKEAAIYAGLQNASGD